MRGLKHTSKVNARKLPKQARFPKLQQNSRPKSPHNEGVGYVDFRSNACVVYIKPFLLAIDTQHM